MNAPVETLTVDINQPPIKGFTREGQEICYIVLPYGDKNVTLDVELLPTREEGTATALSFYEPHSAIKAPLFDQWVCGFLVSTQVLTSAYYEESAFTHPNYEIVRPSFDDPLKKAVSDHLNSFDYEGFDADVAYYLTNTLATLIKEKGKPVIRVIGELISRREIGDDIAYETLRAIGRLQDDSTKRDRFELMVTLLQNDTALIRDGAVIGLSFLDDRKALPSLRMLLEKETVPVLKENIKVAIKDLETP